MDIAKHVAIIARKDDDHQHTTYLRVCEPGNVIEKELSPYEIILMVIKLNSELEKHMQHKNFDYHNDDD